MDQKLLCEIKIEFVAYPRIPHCLKIHEQLGNTQATVASSMLYIIEYLNVSNAWVI